MKVAELIKELKKMPQNIEVGVSAHDNSEFEIAGWPSSVTHRRKKDFDPQDDPSADVDMIDSNPKEWVDIHC